MSKSKYPIGTILRPNESIRQTTLASEARYITLSDEVSESGMIRIFVQKSAQPDGKPRVMDWYENMMEIAPKNSPEIITMPVVVDIPALRQAINQTLRDSLGTVEYQLERLLADAVKEQNWGAVEFLGKELREFKEIADKYEV